MYLDNNPSLSALRGFLTGYDLALSSYTDGKVSGNLLPQDFSEWVAYRLGFYSSQTGWRNMILDRIHDESAALKRFFELLDEHRVRKARVVAQVQGYTKILKAPEVMLADGTLKQQEWSDVRPATLKLIAYTDNRGFFVDSDEEFRSFEKGRFFSTLWWFTRELGVDDGNLTILEPETYARWVSQENRSD
ncbi:MAG TPA: hypothetical protein VFO39_10530 [Candidatus Sulfotelmatobacter sp.]|nr:hypothetical protein [Candidatus Sulfotelmatobacter sp.]